MNALTHLDWAGLVVWALLWLGYALWADRGNGRPDSLMVSIAHHRREWMREAYRRDNRITDVGLIGSLMQSATFFSSTTLLILGGLFAVLGTIEKSAEVLQGLPFAARTTQELLEIKALALTLVFIYAFLRFTWSLRQFNLVGIVVGSYPTLDVHRADDDRVIVQASILNELAGSNFAQGLRAYYFAIPLLVWLINPWLLLGGALVITATTYYMEFRSATVRALYRDLADRG